MQDAVRVVVEQWSRLDLAVIIQDEPSPTEFLKLSEAEFDASVDGPLAGLLTGIRAASEPMRGASAGCIICVFSCGQHGAAAAARLGAAEMLIRATAVELAPFGIRVGGVAAPHIKQHPEVIANTVTFLASADASYVTGTTVICESNRTL
jgi:NAD(P)-dependent dehydrogenase (short-subunit alcohol dehydrogenase family)